MKKSKLLVLLPVLLGLGIVSCGDTSTSSTTSEENASKNTVTKDTSDNTQTSDDVTSTVDITTSDETTSVDETTSEDETTSDETTSEERIVTLYFQDKAWWAADTASSSIYYWGESGGNTWPGTRMELVSSESDVNTWKFDLDVSLYTNFIFTRTHTKYGLEDMPEGENVDWGAQTIDLAYEEGVNLYTLENETPSWGGGETACTVIKGVYSE